VSSRYEPVFISSPGVKRLTAATRGAAEITVAGIVYRDTGQRCHGFNYRYSLRKKGVRWFTPTGMLTIRHRYQAGSLEALVCEATGQEPHWKEVAGPAAVRRSSPRISDHQPASQEQFAI
jgi:hypothetical protein